jgi:hypothetical protein
VGRRKILTQAESKMLLILDGYDVNRGEGMAMK